MTLRANFRRWLPFFAFATLAIVFSLYFFLTVPSSNYHPKTDNPAIIYFEACSHCHGKTGQASNLLYPNLAGKALKPLEVEKVIRQGALFMPAFKHIQGDTLQQLVDYIVEQRFLQN